MVHLALIGIANKGLRIRGPVIKMPHELYAILIVITVV